MTEPSIERDEMGLVEGWKLDLQKVAALAAWFAAMLLLAGGTRWLVVIGGALAALDVWWALAHRGRLASRMHAARLFPPTRDPRYSQLASDLGLLGLAVLLVVIVVLARTGAGP
jgi:hypothetical protein